MVKPVPPSTPTIAAAIRVRSDRHVREMLKEGADPNATHHGMSLLEMAFESGHVPSILALVEHGADPNQCFSGGVPCIHRAVAMHYAPLVDALMERGALLNVGNPTKAGASPLCHATIGSSRLMIDQLLRWGADPNWKDEEGQTPLHHAANVGNTRAVAQLLSAGARVEAKDRRGHTPSQCARRFWESQAGGRGEQMLEMIRPFEERAALERGVAAGPNNPRRL